MTEASHDVFVDRRTAEQKMGELATQILFWYDEAGKGKSWRDIERDEKTSNQTMKRRRTNGVAMTLDGSLVVARSECSRKDQFCRVSGRHIVEQRILNAELAVSRSLRRKVIEEERRRKAIEDANDGAPCEKFSSREDFCWLLRLDETQLEDLPTEAARVYSEMFPEDERGIKRAFNAGNVFIRYKAEIERRANELDDFND